MPNIQIITASMQHSEGFYGIIATEWNAYIVDHLINGAVNTLTSHGIQHDKITLVKCPGAFEIPLTAKKLAATQRYDALISLGAVIRGGTAHFEYVAGQAVSGISSVMLSSEIPITFGILTVDTIEQAAERAGTKMGNKGSEAAKAALDMVSILRKIDQI